MSIPDFPIAECATPPPVSNSSLDYLGGSEAINTTLRKVIELLQDKSLFILEEDRTLDIRSEQAFGSLKIYLHILDQELHMHSGVNESLSSSSLFQRLHEVDESILRLPKFKEHIHNKWPPVITVPTIDVVNNKVHQVWMTAISCFSSIQGTTFEKYLPQISVEHLSEDRKALLGDSKQFEDELSSWSNRAIKYVEYLKNRPIIEVPPPALQQYLRVSALPKENDSSIIINNKIDWLRHVVQSIRVAYYFGLSSLDLEGCSLDSLPKCIGRLTQLEKLDLSKNRLTVLPPQIGDLINLQVLNLKDNKLTVLPPQIGNLLNLDYLNISNNYLSQCPDTLINLEKLKTFSVNGSDSLYNKAKSTKFFERSSYHCSDNYRATWSDEIEKMLIRNEVSVDDYR